MINKIDLINGRLNNIQFHIEHVIKGMNSPELYVVPENKVGVDLDLYLQNLIDIKLALEAEKASLTNQDKML